MKTIKANSFSKTAAYTLIELLAVIGIISLAMIGFEAVSKEHGVGMRIAAAMAGGAAGLGLVALFYRWAWSNDQAHLRKLKTDYLGIYKVLANPDGNQPSVMLEGAEIRVGDYGWEAMPLVQDGLIYLHGLTPDWRTVWHAGFHSAQIKRVGLKPSSQYDHWVPYWAKPPPDLCPFPIQARTTPTMGRPHHFGKYFKAYPQPGTGTLIKLKCTAFKT